MTRGDALLMALVASDNRAAAALARTYPGGTEAFVRAMNAKAKKLGMTRTRYADSTGLDEQNVSTAQDLVKLIGVAYKNPTIRKMSSTPKGSITDLRTGRKVEFFNTNGLVRQKSWDVNLSKTGYIAPAGHCLLMHVEIGGRPLIIVLLKSWGKYSRIGDANRIKKWLVNNEKRARRVSTIARS
ncbi:MAG: D-alanyl-D-alanine endopeptidase (penicillin-binding protein 7) [Halothiobacillaceae bacterium]|nr:MAG: D-alanyl-D-alanine endopeptidase (penicillin-binding protein 7) [Halothiobacillaceae bacterium]